LRAAGREEHPERSLESVLAAFPDDPAQPRPGGVKIAPKFEGDERPFGPGAAAFSPERKTSNELGTNTPSGEAVTGSTGGSLQTRTEDRGYRHSLGFNELESPGPVRFENGTAAAPEVKLNRSRQSLDSEKASPPGIASPGRNSMTNTFWRQRFDAEVLSPAPAAKRDAIEVLEKLSVGASPAPVAPRPSRQVHIGKLHIKVERPPVARPEQQPAAAAEARRSPQPAGRVFPDPWERHYLSLD
jgi:hypothetical protein